MTRAHSDINVTPLIDVMLVLLIIFMVVTPSAEKGLDVAVPEADRRETFRPTDVALVLEVGPAGALRLNSLPVPGLDGLRTRLRDVYATRVDKILFVRGDARAVYGAVVAAMDVARGSGVERIGVMTGPAALSGFDSAPTESRTR